MPAFSPLRQHPFPIDTDPQNVAVAIEQLARSVDSVTGTETLRRYTSVAARDAVNPVPQEGQMCFCTVAPGGGNGMRFIGRGGAWWALGMCVFNSKASAQGIVADGAWQVVTFTTSHWNVLSSYNGSVWTAPFKGYAHVVASFSVMTTNSGGAQVPVDSNQSAIGLYFADTSGGAVMLPYDYMNGRWSHTGLMADTVLGVEPGHTVSVQGWCNAPGLTKTIHGTGGFYIEYV